MKTFGIEWLEMEQTPQTDPNNRFNANVVSNIRFATNAGPEIPDEVLLRAYYDGGGVEAENDGSFHFNEWMRHLITEYANASKEG